MRNKSYDQATDQELLEKFYSERDNYWIGLILQRYTLLLFGVCMKYLRNEEEAKDAVQQIFLKTITELHKYKVDYFKSWLYMVAKNYCLMKIRDNHGKSHTGIQEENILMAEEEGQLQLHLQKDEHLELMARSLEELNPEQKQCVTLFYLEKQSYHDIAAVTGFSLMQVKSHIQNGKRNLKNFMEKKLNKS
ncbi:MAG TPA: sigma-70 family RNA polymerase sigma factor [Flavitalea sp.]|nr:sigma-70 family RNA polymerase sigma factor [Flavitalea sp.]